jgi:hypothetical protein
VSRLGSRWGLAILLVVTVMAYLPLRHAGFVWDDAALVQNNALTADVWGNLGAIFTSDLWHTLRLTGADSGYYRPLMLLSMGVDRWLFELEPAGHHLHSVAWHLAAVAALFGVLRRVTPPGPALLGAALFALHPVQVEAVALIAARNDAMAAAMGLGAIALLLDTPTPVRLVGAALLSTGAMLSKETAVLLPVMLLAVDLAQRSPLPWSKRLIRYSALTVGIVAYAGLRAWVGIGSAGLPGAEAWTPVIDQAGHIAGTYGALVTWPWPLTPARSLRYAVPLSPLHVGAAAVTLGLAVASAWSGRRRRLALAGWGWALLALAPTLVATAGKGLLGERYLYLPLAGVALALAAAVSLKPRRHLALLALGAPMIAAVSARLPDWTTSRDLWTAAHNVHASPYSHGALGFYVYQDRDYAEAREHFRGAVGGSPPYLESCTHLVMANLGAQDPHQAVLDGGWGLRERGCPQIAETLGYYGVALAASGRWEEAGEITATMTRDPLGHAQIVHAGWAVKRLDFATYERIAAAWDRTSPLEGQVAKLLELSGDARALELYAAWLRGDLRRVDPTTLDAAALEAQGAQIIVAP